MQLCFKIHGNYKCAATSEKTLVYMKKHFWYVCVCVCVRLYVGGRVCACVCVYADNGLLWQQQNKETQIMSLWLLLSAPLFAFPWHLLSPLSSLPYILSLIPVSPVVLFPYPTLRLTDSRRFILIWMKVELLFLQAKHTHTHTELHTHPKYSFAFSHLSKLK